MSEHRFDGRVAIVTGAGRGIGRAYARLLAARGAAVVVNDLGGAMDGVGADVGPASAVADEITAAGGAAVADGSDVATVSGAAAMVAAALDAFGRVDVVVNNAGIIRWAGFPDADAANLADHLAVHVAGSFHTARAAWPRMVDQGYGRIVMTTSTGMLGLAQNTSYATAKGGVVGLARSLAVAGARHGIRVNCIAPAANTRMGDGGPPEMTPEQVAPMAAYLAHESCPATGEVYVAGAGRFSRLFLATTEGYVHTGDGPTVEDVAEHWSEINDESGYSVPADLMDWSARFLSHLRAGDGRD